MASIRSGSQQNCLVLIYSTPSILCHTLSFNVSVLLLRAACKTSEIAAIFQSVRELLTVNKLSFPSNWSSYGPGNQIVAAHSRDWFRMSHKEYPSFTKMSAKRQQNRSTPRIQAAFGSNKLKDWCTFRILGGWQAVSLGGGMTVTEKRKFWQGG